MVGWLACLAGGALALVLAGAVITDGIDGSALSIVIALPLSVCLALFGASIVAIGQSARRNPGVVMATIILAALGVASAYGIVHAQAQ